MLRRVFKSIIYQPSKTLLLFVVMSILSLSLCTSFIIKESTSKLRYSILSNTKPEVILFTKLDPKIDFNITDTDRYFFNSKNEYDIYRNNILDDINNIATKAHANYYDINLDATFFYSYDQNEDIFYTSYTNNESNRDYLGAIYSEIKNIDYRIKDRQFPGIDISLTSISDPNFSELYFEHNTILKGRTFNKKEIENGDNVIIITSNMVAYNADNNEIRKLDIGDSFMFSYPYVQDNGIIANKQYEFEIIGILENDYRQSVISKDRTIKNAYIPNKTLESIINECIGLDFNYQSEDGVYYPFYRVYPTRMVLDSLDDIDIFIEEIDKLNFQGREYTYETSADNYMVLGGDIESLSQSFTILFYFSIASSILILVFIISIEVNKRKIEIGILESLGESTIKISIQIIFEYLIILLASFVISLLISKYFATIFSNNILNNVSDNSFINASAVFDSNLTNTSDILSKYKITLDLKDACILLVIELSSMLLAIIISTLLIMSFSPKEILLDE